MVSIFFSDIQGFTTISQGLDPQTLADLLNEYLTDMTDIIHSQHGTLDKYIGDAIVAFWNAPVDQPDHALRACRARPCRTPRNASRLSSRRCSSARTITPSALVFNMVLTSPTRR